jgi:uncharacterized membrane protein
VEAGQIATDLYEAAKPHLSWFVPAIFGLIVIAILLRIFDESAVGFVKKILQEMNSFARAPHNPMSLDFGGGLLVFVTFLLWHLSDVVHQIMARPHDSSIIFLAFAFFLAIYFLLSIKLFSNPTMTVKPPTTPSKRPKARKAKTVQHR